MEKEKSIARGCQQRYWLSQMLAGGCHSATYELRGKAKSYAGNYARSFYALTRRMRAAGYVISYAPGPRGGEWGAIYSAEKGVGA